MMKEVFIPKTLVIGIDPGTLHHGLAWWKLDSPKQYKEIVQTIARTTLKIPVFGEHDFARFTESLKQNQTLSLLSDLSSGFERICIGIEEPIDNISVKKHSNCKDDPSAAQILRVTAWWEKIAREMFTNADIARISPYNWTSQHFGSRDQFMKKYDFRTDHEASAALASLFKARKLMHTHTAHA